MTEPCKRRRGSGGLIACADGGVSEDGRLNFVFVLLYIALRRPHQR